MLRVWHIPQVPGEPFHVNVASIKEAAKIINVLANYDAFQFEGGIKPDYCNASGLEMRGDDGEWEEYEDEEGDDIHEVMNNAWKACMYDLEGASLEKVRAGKEAF